MEKGEFGPIYRQFKGNPKGAVRHLMKKRTGECIAAFNHPQIGDIDIVWGEVTNADKHEGYGLSHIIDKHGKDIEAFGFKLEDFVAIVLQFGDFSVSKKRDAALLESNNFRLVVERNYKGKPKNWILTSFVIYPKKKSCKPKPAT